MIAPSSPCRAVWCSQQCCNLVGVEECDCSPHVTLVGHCKDALAMQHQRGISHGNIAEERADRSEPSVAAAGRVSTRRLRVGEKVGHHVSTDIFNGKPDWRLAVPCTGKAQQQAERVAVARNRMMAGLQLGTQSVGEEALDQSRKGCGIHWIASPPWAIARVIARSSSSGTASRYQYVWEGLA